jgi:hypothetical protein
VVGDRRILRFLRGKQLNVHQAAQMFSDFLYWREENNMNEIRHEILYEGLNTPLAFPGGKKIIELAPQIVVAANALDRKGQPLGKMLYLKWVTL